MAREFVAEWEGYDDTVTALAATLARREG